MKLAGELPRPAAGDLKDLPDVVHLTQSCVRRIRAWLLASSSSRSIQGRTPTKREQDFERVLQDKPELLEAMLDKLGAADAPPLTLEVSRQISRRRGRCAKRWRD